MTNKIVGQSLTSSMGQFVCFRHTNSMLEIQTTATVTDHTDRSGGSDSFQKLNYRPFLFFSDTYIHDWSEFILVVGQMN